MSFFLQCYSLSLLHFYLFQIVILAAMFAVLFVCLVSIKSHDFYRKLIIFVQKGYSPFKQFADPVSYRKAIKNNTNIQLAKLQASSEYLRLKALKMKANYPGNVFMFDKINHNQVRQTINALQGMQDFIYEKQKGKYRTKIFQNYTH